MLEGLATQRLRPSRREPVDLSDSITRSRSVSCTHLRLFHTSHPCREGDKTSELVSPWRGRPDRYHGIGYPVLTPSAAIECSCTLALRLTSSCAPCT
jgi:hypothetical protein